MNYDEALEIIDEYLKWSDSSCICFLGNPPCCKCENQPSEDDYENALNYVEDIDRTK